MSNRLKEPKEIFQYFLHRSLYAQYTIIMRTRDASLRFSGQRLEMRLTAPFPFACEWDKWYYSVYKYFMTCVNSFTMLYMGDCVTRPLQIQTQACITHPTSPSTMPVQPI